MTKPPKTTDSKTKLLKYFQAPILRYKPFCDCHRDKWDDTECCPNILKRLHPKLYKELTDYHYIGPNTDKDKLEPKMPTKTENTTLLAKGSKRSFRSQRVKGKKVKNSKVAISDAGLRKKDKGSITNKFEKS